MWMLTWMAQMSKKAKVNRMMKRMEKRWSKSRRKRRRKRRLSRRLILIRELEMLRRLYPRKQYLQRSKHIKSRSKMAVLSWKKRCTPCASCTNSINRPVSSTGVSETLGAPKEITRKLVKCNCLVTCKCTRIGLLRKAPFGLWVRKIRSSKRLSSMQMGVLLSQVAVKQEFTTIIRASTTSSPLQREKINWRWKSKSWSVCSLQIIRFI